MLSCREVTERASRLIDGELGFVERARVALHLAICANCRRFVRQFSALLEAVARRPTQLYAQPTDAFVSRVTQTLTTGWSGSSSDDSQAPR